MQAIVIANACATLWRQVYVLTGSKYALRSRDEMHYCDSLWSRHTGRHEKHAALPAYWPSTFCKPPNLVSWVWMSTWISKWRQRRPINSPHSVKPQDHHPQEQNIYIYIYIYIILFLTFFWNIWTVRSTYGFFPEDWWTSRTIDKNYIRKPTI